jgi:hypothetical protein
LAAVFALVVAAVATARPAAAQEAPPELFRLFLADGRVLTAYGEWARLDESVVFSMPTDRGDPAAGLHLVTIPASSVDWARTERYALSLRAKIYAATRGEADFARLGDEVARTLNEVATLTDPNERLARVELARRTLSEWPAAHYGYRALEVREMLGVLDDVMVDLRAAAGRTGPALALVAPPAVLPDEPLLPEPSEAELAEQLLTAAGLASTPAERTSLLQTLLGLLDRAAALLPEAWAARLRTEATGTLAEEQRLDRAYAELRTSTMTRAAHSAARADVRALERLRGAVHAADRRLGARRPGEITSLLAAVDAQLDAARRLQLARDQWELRRPALQRYRRALGRPLGAIERHSGALEDVRAQAGPPVSRLPGILDRWRRDGLGLDRVVPPEGLAPVHALFRSAWTMAEQAFALRLSAAADNDLARAEQASSAAAGALMLLARARADLEAALARPAALTP